MQISRRLLIRIRWKYRISYRDFAKGGDLMFPTIDKQRTGQRLRKIMKQQNITVKQVQEYLNLSCVQSVYHWLDGTSMPTIDNLYALSELFEVPIDYLVCGNRKYKGASNICDFNTRMMEYYIRLVDVA